MSPVLAEQDVEQTYDELLNFEQNFFQSAEVAAEPEVKTEEEKSSNTYYTDENGPLIQKEERFVRHMPLFKKIRLRIQKAIKIHNIKTEKSQIAREKRWYERDLKKEMEKEKQALEGLDIKYMDYDGAISTEISPETKKEEQQSQEVGLVGEVEEQATENEVMLDCDIVSTDENTGEVEAIGNPIVIFPSQQIKLTADKMIYNHESNILKAIGNVVLTKEGIPVYGDYLQVNMNEENIFIDNVKSEPSTMKITARKAESSDGLMVLTEGHMYSNESQKLNLITRMAGPDYSQMIVRDEDRSFFNGDGSASVKLVSSSINVKAGKEHDIFEAKDTEVYYNDKYLFTWPSFTAYTNKDREYFEANYPELGSMSKLGMFIGPGLVVPTPFGSTLKLIPTINYKHGFGFGGVAKFKSAFNDTQFAYSSAANTVVLRGRHDLDEHLFLQYGINSYTDNWFLGRRMPKYLAELVYHKSTVLPNFLAEGRDLRFTHRASAAYAKDGNWNMRTEHISSSGVDTARFRYMAEINQNLFRYTDKPNRKVFELNLLMQGSAAVYGTGDTQFIGRIGPNIHSQYKYWMQDISFFMSGYSDHTPMPVYDMYRYGHSNIYIREALRLNKYISVGWLGSVTLGKDSPNEKLFQENGFFISIGPDDLKLNLGYDFMRKMTYFTIGLAIDAKNTTVDFDKMTIKNAERLGKSDKEADDVAFRVSDPKQISKKSSKKLQYAEVIDIEDPNKEHI